MRAKRKWLVVRIYIIYCPNDLINTCGVLWLLLLRKLTRDCMNAHWKPNGYFDNLVLTSLVKEATGATGHGTWDNDMYEKLSQVIRVLGLTEM